MSPAAGRYSSSLRRTLVLPVIFAKGVRLLKKGRTLKSATQRKPHKVAVAPAPKNNKQIQLA
jgi:hypothetical protein